MLASSIPRIRSMIPSLVDDGGTGELSCGCEVLWGCRGSVVELELGRGEEEGL